MEATKRVRTSEILEKYQGQLAVIKDRYASLNDEAKFKMACEATKIKSNIESTEFTNDVSAFKQLSMLICEFNACPEFITIKGD